VATLVLPLAGVAVALGALTRRRPLARLVVVAATTWSVLGGRSLGTIATELARAVDAGDLAEARRRLPSLAGRDPTTLDGAELCRATVESVAENTTDAVVGALVWGALAGLPGLAVYRAVNTLDAMVGHRDRRYERFGWTAARLDDVLGWPGARVAAGLAVLMAPTAGGDRRTAWRVLRRDGARHPSPNAGRLEAVFAGTLDVRLGGTNRYGNRIEHRPELGDGHPPGPEDVRRAVVLSRRIGIGATVLCALAAATLGRRQP
jgi:adenosylcobinamide-phosphate synthase